MSFADDMARLLSLSVVKGEELLELADLWAGGGHASEAFVHVILGEMATLEKMMFSSRTPSRPFAGQCGGGSGQSHFVAAEDACGTWICRTSITSDADSCCTILSVSTRTGSNAHWKETVKCEALRVAKRISHFSGGFAHFRQV